MTDSSVTTIVCRLSEKLSSVCTPLDDIRQVFADSPLHARTLLLLFLVSDIACHCVTVSPVTVPLCSLL